LKQLVIRTVVPSYGAGYHAAATAYPRDVLYEKEVDFVTHWIELL